MGARVQRSAPMINVPQAFQYLVSCFADRADPERASLHRALAHLSSAAGWHERLETVSAHVLMAGLEILCTAEHFTPKVRRLTLMRDHLGRLLQDQPRPTVFPTAIIALWAD